MILLFRSWYWLISTIYFVDFSLLSIFYLIDFCLLFPLLTLDLICSSYSSCLLWELRTLSLHFYNISIKSYKFSFKHCFRCCFHYITKYFPIFFLILSLNHRVFRSVFFCFQVIMDFSRHFKLLISDWIPLWLESISSDLNLYTYWNL